MCHPKTAAYSVLCDDIALAVLLSHRVKRYAAANNAPMQAIFERALNALETETST